jgi:hypothetical protein
LSFGSFRWPSARPGEDESDARGVVGEKSLLDVTLERPLVGDVDLIGADQFDIGDDTLAKDIGCPTMKFNLFSSRSARSLRRTEQ